MQAAMNGDMSRRSFLKGAAVAGATLGASGAMGFDIFHPAEAFADANAPVEKRFTYCDMCNHVPRCGIWAYVKEEKIVRVESREQFSPSPLCAKGIASLQELYDPHRLLHPMKRTNPKGESSKWEQITWEEAYSTIASKFNEIKARDGADKVMFYCGDPKEPRGAVVRLANIFGSPHFGTESSLCAMATLMGGQMMFGMPTMGANPSKDSKSCLIWTLNAAWSQPNRFKALTDAKENGTKFVVIDPRVTPTVTSCADVHLQIRPGTDAALGLGMLNYMFETGQFDEDFATKWCHGFDQLKEHVKDWTLDKVAEITWIPEEKIKAAVDLLWANRPGTLITSSAGHAHQTNIGNTQRLIHSVYSLMGNLDVAGGLSFSPGLPFNMFQTTNEFDMVPKYNAELRALRCDHGEFPIWEHYQTQFQTAHLPEYVADGKIKAAIMFGVNAMMWPNTPLYQKAIQDLEFSAAVDYYERPWTHDYVDMLLPAAMCYERMAPLDQAPPKLYVRDVCVKPQGEAREDWQIVWELGCALGFEDECFGGSVEASLEYLLQTSGLGVTMADLRANPDGISFAKDFVPKKYETGGIRADGQPGFNTPTGKVELFSTVADQYGFSGLPTYSEPIYGPKSPEFAQYPLILNSGSRVPMYTHSKLRDLPWLNQFMPDPLVRLNKKDADARGLKNGDDVKVFNWQCEEGIKMKLEVTNLVMPGVVDIFHGWHQADVNRLTTRDFDPMTGYPPFRSGLCEVAKI